MMKFSAFSKKKHTLKRKLFVYMFLLVVLLLLLFCIGILLIDGYSGIQQQITDTLAFQSEVFERQIVSHYSNLAVMGIQLSEQTGKTIDHYLNNHHLDFSALNGAQSRIAEIQEELIEPLHQKLLETDCTGTFILLDTQINPSVENAATSRSGLYLQRNSLDSTDTRVLLYRGLSDVGKRHNAMPHRKWRLEFNTDLVPDYDKLYSLSPQPLKESFHLTDVVTLPGTSERVMLLTVPIWSSTGERYGLCGLEISESYFKHIFAQPSELSHVVFCLSPGETGLSSAEKSLSAGIINDYYLAPSGQFHTESFGKDLFTCESAEASYIGIIKPVQLCADTEAFSISTLMLREDYDRLATRSSMRIALLLFVIGAFAVIFSLTFSKRYLLPLKQSLNQIRKKEYAHAESQLIEIDDLFAFLAEQDRQSEAMLAAVQKEKSSVEAALAQIQTERTHDKQELQRLAYSRKTEVDPDDYENFCRGIQNLTATERRVFNYYLDGKSVKEITELMGVKESTVRFHNRNIYMTLGVKSLKQLLRCAAILKQEQEAGTSSN